MRTLHRDKPRHFSLFALPYPLKRLPLISLLQLCKKPPAIIGRGLCFYNYFTSK